MSIFALIEDVGGHRVEAYNTPGGVVLRDTYSAPGTPATVALVFLTEVRLDTDGPPVIRPTRPGRSPHG